MKKNILIIVLLFCLGIGTGKAQYTDLLNFNSTNSPEGANPYGNLLLSAGRLYGMTSNGGKNAYGNIFSIDTNGNNYKDLWDFDDTGSNGSNPVSSLLLVNDRLYGTTGLGGKYSSGNIFSINTNGSDYRNLLNFHYQSNVIGASYEPLGSLTLSGGKLYGMARLGGLYGYGCIFSIDTISSDTTGGYKDIFDFNGTNGVYPTSALTLSGAILYGMAPNGGTNNYGSIFSIDTNGNNYKDLLNFKETNGQNPYGELTLSGKLLYGMTSMGGKNDYGCIFSIDTDGSAYKDMLDFNGVNGLSPYGNLTLSGKLLYGMTYEGGAYSDGVIFSIDTTGNQYKDLVDFNTTNGSSPQGSLILAGNALYGMTSAGGTYSDGIIFRLDTLNRISSINEITATKSSIAFYPNPSNGIFTIQSSVASGQPSVIEVYNVLGEQVLTETLRSTQGDNLINLSRQPNGIYLYRVIANTGELMGEGKLIIQK